MKVKTYWIETAFLKKVSLSSSAFLKVSNQTDLTYISVLKHVAIYMHLRIIQLYSCQFQTKKQQKKPKKSTYHIKVIIWVGAMVFIFAKKRLLFTPKEVIFSMVGKKLQQNHTKTFCPKTLTST